MTIPHVKGRVARQAHVGLPEGTCEEEYARSGFSGAYAHLYRSEPPVGWTRIEGPLRPRAFDPTKDATPRAGDWLADRRALLANDDVVVSFGTLTAAMGYAFRNADADEILFVHQGGGTLESDFGPIAYRRGDYLVIPRGTAYRLVPVDNTALLVCETRGEVRFPERGMLGQHALFDPAVVEVPTPEAGASTLAANAAGEWELRVKRRSEITRVFYPFCPLNTVGWKGTLSVQRLNVADIRPVMSERYHLPPSAHTTFVADGVVLCTFLPRALENGDPEALKVPFFHSNIDFDEVLFYHDGDFFSRVGISPGMMTFHPQGIHHGPQPGAAERAAKADRTQEIAVMIDTRRPLDMLAAAEAVENTDYWKSWGARG
ncbi:MAG: homogentisate 1,2-dioxygenase [Myxococcales bacterium]|nr:homogentisate 1,2-dioxygenase [Myxococcales bacterium]MCB9736549.1 homogentisate 1,2-dioxygenase [Deltaproteobacteria bacterium]